MGYYDTFYGKQSWMDCVSRAWNEEFLKLNIVHFETQWWFLEASSRKGQRRYCFL